MPISRRTFTRTPFAIALTGIGALTGGAARAQSSAGQPTVRLVVPWPAGGSTDAVARLLAERLRGDLAATIVVDNKGGAGGRLGLEYMKTAPADGSVFVVNPASGFVIYPHVYKKLSYDPFRDFIPVTRICRYPFAIAVGPAVPAGVTTVAELLAWCRDNPRDAAYGVSALGSGTHFAGVKFAKDGGVALRAIAYRGDAPLMQDLLGGIVPIAFIVLASALPQIGAGRLRVIATTGAKRSALTPNVAAVRETLPGYEVDEWFGAFLPRGASPEVVRKLDAAISAALKSDALQQGLTKLGFEAAGESQADFARVMRSDLERWGPIVQASGFTAED
jgi:tripartite-type tricarboxylate transporter receptor subunit TctC